MVRTPGRGTRPLNRLEAEKQKQVQEQDKRTQQIVAKLQTRKGNKQTNEEPRTRRGKSTTRRDVVSTPSPTSTTPASSKTKSSRKSSTPKANKRTMTPRRQSVKSNKSSESGSKAVIDDALDAQTKMVEDRTEKKYNEILNKHQLSSTRHSERTFRKDVHRQTRQDQHKTGQQQHSRMNSLMTILACSMAFGILFYAITRMTIDPESNDAYALPSGVKDSFAPALIEYMRIDIVVHTILGLFVGAIVGFFKS